MVEIIPGIYHLQVPIPNSPLGHTNAYLVRENKECLLVDTGWNTPEAFDALSDQLTEIGARFEDISQIVVTHIHPDHYGLAGRLKQLSHAKVCLDYLGKDFIESRYINIDKLLDVIAQWLHVNGVPANILSQLQAASVGMRKFVTPTLPDVILRGGETITLGSFNFRVLWTPGHSPGHISLYEPRRKVLLSGDHILPGITPNVSLHPQTSADPLHDYLNSLDAMKQLEVNLVLPGHEEPFSNLQLRIEQLVQHHQERNAEILAALNRELKTGYQIATQITWKQDISGAGWDSLEPWEMRMAVLETLAHLEAMRVDGKLDKFTREDIIYYQHRNERAN